MNTETPLGAKPPPAGARNEAARIVFLHGRGSDESSAAQFGTAFEGATLMAPRGMLREGEGYAWFRNYGPGVADQSSLQDCVNYLESWLGQYAESPDARVWLCGYSNGAAAAGALLLSNPHRYHGAVLISGPLVSQRPWPQARLSGLPVLLLYGEDDRVIPRHLLNETAAYLSDASGARASIVQVAGGHAISKAALIPVREWFATEVASLRRAAAGTRAAAPLKPC
jgi:phospholipase/carboxylesterase